MSKSFTRRLGVLFFAVYLVFLSLITMDWSRILRLDFSAGSRYNWQLLQGIGDILKSQNLAYVFRNIAGNVILFVPFGLLLPLFWRRGRRFVPTLLAGMFSSVAIESVQFFTGRGADVDDVLLNTLGTALGFLIYSIRPAASGSSGGTAGSRRPQHEIPRSEPPNALPLRRKRKRHRRLSAVVCLLLCSLIPGGVLLNKALKNPSWPPDEAMSTLTQGEIPPRIIPGVWSGGESLHSETAYLLSLEDNQVLWEKSSNTRIFPASMTKIMTALVAIEQLSGLDERVALREGIFKKTAAENAATAGFFPGEQVEAIDLLYGTMLPSGAECALGLAEHIAGSEEAFVRLMNQKAEQLGLEDTCFSNATGLHSPRHYTTARDIGALLRSALENELFETIFTTARYTTAPTALHPDGVALTSTLFSRMNRDELPGVFLLGGKTGYTHEAGQCLASLAEVDGLQYILVTAGAYPEDPLTQVFHVDDARMVYASIP